MKKQGSFHTGPIFAALAWKDSNRLVLGEVSQVAIGSVAHTAKVIACQGSVVALGTTDVEAALKADTQNWVLMKVR